VLTEIIRFVGKGSTGNFWLLLVADSVWKILLLFICFSAVYVSLRIVTRSLSGITVLATCIYFYSVTQVGWHVFIFIINAIEKGLPCERIESEYSSFIDCSSVNPDLASIETWKTLFGLTEYAVYGTAIIGLIWLLRSWFIWSKLFSISISRCFGSLCLFGVFAPILLTMALFIRFSV